MVTLTEFCNVQGLENGEENCYFSTYRTEWLRETTNMHSLPPKPQYTASSNDRGRFTLMRPLACMHIFGLDVTHSDIPIYHRGLMLK